MTKGQFAGGPCSGCQLPSRVTLTWAVKYQPIVLSRGHVHQLLNADLVVDDIRLW